MKNITRRRFFRFSAAAGLGSWLHAAWAMGKRPEFQGIHRAKGDVRVNGAPAKIGTPVNVGDTVTTGAKSEVIFVVGEDAFLLRENGRLTIAGEGGLATRLRVLSGRLLSVFAPNRAARRFETATAVIGVRGTGIYIESEPDRTYVCTCYGTADLAAAADPAARETVTTNHHEEPRYIHRQGTRDRLIEPAKVANHTDEELAMLEWLVGRFPPFQPGRDYT
jgi:hypothetical protein